jgi:transglutaminase-like putative cysteine protease
VTLRRRITNGGPDALTEANIYVALPSDDHGQTLHGEPTFEPKPAGIVTDQWGQRAAHFVANNIAAGASFEVKMTVRTTLHTVRFHIDPTHVGDLRDIPRDVARTYLGDGSKLGLTHPSIVSHTKRAVGGETRPYWIARNIARYIQDKMHYELVGGWNIAPTVIDRGSGSCSEYTFVFLAMCRAAGIPARYVGAVVVRGDDASTDAVFHRWPEIYLPGYGWVPLDAQAGDKPQPEKQAEAMLELPNRFLTTTRGGGASTVLGWDYNGTANWTCSGRCDVSELHVGDWYPAREAATTP